METFETWIVFWETNKCRSCTYFQVKAFIVVETLPARRKTAKTILEFILNQNSIWNWWFYRPGHLPFILKYYWNY